MTRKKPANATPSEPSFNPDDEFPFSMETVSLLLMEAVACDDGRAVERLLDENHMWASSEEAADPIIANNPVACAAASGSESCLVSFFEATDSYLWAFANNASLWHIAVAYRQNHLFPALDAFSCDPNTFLDNASPHAGPSGRTPLALAVENGLVETVSELLSYESVSSHHAKTAPRISAIATGLASWLEKTASGDKAGAADVKKCLVLLRNAGFAADGAHGSVNCAAPLAFIAEGIEEETGQTGIVKSAISSYFEMDGASGRNLQALLRPGESADEACLAAVFLDPWLWALSERTGTVDATPGRREFLIASAWKTFLDDPLVTVTRDAQAWLADIAREIGWGGFLLPKPKKERDSGPASSPWFMREPMSMAVSSWLENPLPVRPSKPSI